MRFKPCEEIGVSRQGYIGKDSEVFQSHRPIVFLIQYVRQEILAIDDESL